jgi:hypothetical protein
MKTLTKKWVDYFNQGTELMKAVVDDILNQDKDYRQDYITDVLKHGCQSGVVSSLIYYNDTADFYNKYSDDIYNLLYADMQDFGYQSIPEMIASLNGAKDVGSDEQYKNLLAWYGYERTIQDIHDTLNMES